jgi:hypothetical protein
MKCLTLHLPYLFWEFGTILGETFVLRLASVVGAASASQQDGTGEGKPARYEIPGHQIWQCGPGGAEVSQRECLIKMPAFSHPAAPMTASACLR